MSTKFLAFIYLLVHPEGRLPSESLQKGGELYTPSLPCQQILFSFKYLLAHSEERFPSE